MYRLLALLAFVFALLPACRNQDNTRIVVAVWSDLAVPTEIDSIRIDATRATTTTPLIMASAMGEVPEQEGPRESAVRICPGPNGLCPIA